MKYIRFILLALTFGFLTACGGSDDSGGAPADPNAPVLDVDVVQTVIPGATLSFQVNATDANGDALTFSATATGTDPRLLSPAASYATNQNEVSATFSWTPDSSQIGDYVMEFTVIDNSMEMLSDSKTVTITVLDTSTTAQGRILYRDECGSCHGFEGQTGSSFGVGAPTPTAMNQAFINVGVMSKFRNNYFTADELQMMYDYLCTIPANQPCN